MPIGLAAFIGFGKRGRAWLDELELPEASRTVLDGQRQLMDLLAELIQANDQMFRDVEIKNWRCMALYQGKRP